MIKIWIKGRNERNLERKTKKRLKENEQRGGIKSEKKTAEKEERGWEKN